MQTWGRHDPHQNKNYYKIICIYPHCDVQCLLGGKKDAHCPLLFGRDRHLIHVHTCMHTHTLASFYSRCFALTGIGSFILNICKRTQTNLIRDLLYSCYCIPSNYAFVVSRELLPLVSMMAWIWQWKSMGFYGYFIVCQVKIIR